MTLTPEARRRFGRPCRLAEIGEVGQAKLCAATIVVSGAGFAGEIEARYLRAAGCGVEETARTAPAAIVPDLGLRHEAAREVGEGALRALVGIHAVLGART